MISDNVYKLLQFLALKELKRIKKEEEKLSLNETLEAVTVEFEQSEGSEEAFDVEASIEEALKEAVVDLNVDEIVQEALGESLNDSVREAVMELFPEKRPRPKPQVFKRLPPKK